MDIEEYAAIIEAMLFASSNPLSIRQIEKIVNISSEKVLSAIELLKKILSGPERGTRIVEIAKGYQLCTKPAFEPFVSKLLKNRYKCRLNKASLETLSIIAFKQPITRLEIENIRGVDSTTSIRNLLKSKLITIMGKKETLGRPLLYGTTTEFLLLFGLKNISDLPTLEELKGLCNGENDQTQ